MMPGESWTKYNLIMALIILAVIGLCNWIAWLISRLF